MTGDYFNTAYYPPKAQNWTGGLGSPRELTVGYIDNVVDNDLSRELPGAWVIDSQSQTAGLLKLKTLKQTIARETLAAMQDSSSSTVITETGRTISSPGLTSFTRSPSSRNFILTANLSFPHGARDKDLRAGFEILAGEHESTTLWYQLSNETLSIDRSNSSAAAAKNAIMFDLRSESGLLRLFDIQENGVETIENLRLTLVVDNSLVEVHANDRFALSSWIK